MEEILTCGYIGPPTAVHKQMEIWGGGVAKWPQFSRIWKNSILELVLTVEPSQKNLRDEFRGQSRTHPKSPTHWLICQWKIT